MSNDTARPTDLVSVCGDWTREGSVVDVHRSDTTIITLVVATIGWVEDAPVLIGTEWDEETGLERKDAHGNALPDIIIPLADIDWVEVF